MTELQQKDQAFVANTYARFPLDLVRGKGSYLYDADGKAYIDMGTGIGVNAFGLCDDVWQAAVTNQAATLSHTSNLYYTSPCADLAELLCHRTGMKKVFFGNSGAEANECAVKVARKWGAENKGAEYSTILTLEQSFHGRTLTTLAATGQEVFHALFQPLTPGFTHVKAGDAKALEEALNTHKVCAILLEVVQGEGGVIALDADYLAAVAALAKTYNILLMVDEVQTGNGRTGTLYAYEQFGLQPDVVTTAKGLGGGLPIGACLMGARVANVLGAGSHGSTFGGNPICAAGALTILSRMDETFLAEVRKKSEYIFTELSGAPGVRSVSGLGLMVGIETVRPAKEVVTECMAAGVLCLTAKTKVRLLPALNIPWDALRTAITTLKAVIAKQD